MRTMLLILFTTKHTKLTILPENVVTHSTFVLFVSFVVHH
jgi:hypothetical protein